MPLTASPSGRPTSKHHYPFRECPQRSTHTHTRASAQPALTKQQEKTYILTARQKEREILRRTDYGLHLSPSFYEFFFRVTCLDTRVIFFTNPKKKCITPLKKCLINLCHNGFLSIYRMTFLNILEIGRISLGGGLSPDSALKKLLSGLFLLLHFISFHTVISISAIKRNVCLQF